MDEIDHDADLSREGKERQRHRVATQAIADLEASKTLTKARETVNNVMEQWAKRVGLAIKPAENIAEASIHAQIRDRLAGMKDRMGSWRKMAPIPPLRAPS